MADFGITETAFVVAAVGAAAGAGTAAYATQRQNRVARAVADSEQRAADAQGKQLRAQAALEKQKAIANAERVRGRIRVAAAAAGFDDVGSYEAFLRQSQYDTAVNTSTIDQNLAANLERVRSGLDASFSSLRGRISSPILAGFTGGIQGAQSGLAISSAIPQGSAAAPAQTGTEADFFASGRQVYNADREYQIP